MNTDRSKGHSVWANTPRSGQSGPRMFRVQRSESHVVRQDQDHIARSLGLGDGNQEQRKKQSHGDTIMQTRPRSQTPAWRRAKHLHPTLQARPSPLRFLIPAAGYCKSVRKGSGHQAERRGFGQQQQSTQLLNGSQRRPRGRKFLEGRLKPDRTKCQLASGVPCGTDPLCEDQQKPDAAPGPLLGESDTG
jgi:hypothetical protein